jgi:hypothetical protein
VALAALWSVVALGSTPSALPVRLYILNTTCFANAGILDHTVNNASHLPLAAAFALGSLAQRWLAALPGPALS